MIIFFYIQNQNIERIRTFTFTVIYFRNKKNQAICTKRWKPQSVPFVLFLTNKKRETKNKSVFVCASWFFFHGGTIWKWWKRKFFRSKQCTHWTMALSEWSNEWSLHATAVFSYGFVILLWSCSKVRTIKILIQLSWFHCFEINSRQFSIGRLLSSSFQNGIFFLIY